MRFRDQKDDTSVSLLKKYFWSQFTSHRCRGYSESVILMMDFSAVIPNYSARPEIHPTRAFPFQVSLFLPD